MTSRSKERMAAAFRKLFQSNNKKQDLNATTSSNSNSESPARRLIRHAVKTAEQPIENPKSTSGFFKSKKVTANSVDSKQSCSGHQQKVRSRRLMKELKDAQRLHQHNSLDPLFTVELVNDNLFEWNVRLYRIDSDSELAADMKDMGIPYILLHIIFPENFPFSPPFMRVISPRIEKGFVMEGGAICMELLTPRGWASAYTMEAVIMQFAASLVKGQTNSQIIPDLQSQIPPMTKEKIKPAKV